jgi:xanthine dehydrogenase accessory factor
MPSIILIRGGGDLATGIALRLFRCGLAVAITEIHQPLAIRRSVSFAEAMYEGEMTVEGVSSHKINDPTDLLNILSIFGKQQIPVIEDPDCVSARTLHPLVIVDARMLKSPPSPIGYSPALYIGIGPGFEAGINCQVVVESKRGHTMGRAYYQGCTNIDTGKPEGDPQRVIRAPCEGVFIGCQDIGSFIHSGQVIAEIEINGIEPHINSRIPISAPISGLLRGILHTGIQVAQGVKIGDIDPRNIMDTCRLVSDKSLSIGGSVLEVIFSKPEVRNRLWL